MKLSIQEVRDHGPLDLDGTVPADRMLLEAPGNPLLVAPVRLAIHAEAFDDEILALIQAETRVEMECARCLERFTQPLRATAEAHAPFTMEEVDAGEEARQSLVLALPLKALCRPDCKGLCPRCGGNLNQGPCGCPPESGTNAFSTLKDFKLQRKR